LSYRTGKRGSYLHPSVASP
ncbi:SNF2 family N-terminal domain protein, partial [Vibrio cholerae HC-50A2]